MEAKDTVIKVTAEIIDQYSHLEHYEVGDVDAPITIKEREWDIVKLLEAQAEISFKAGYFEGRGLGIRDGMREVVEWIEKHSEVDNSYPTGNKRLYLNFEWQAQKEEWGV